MKRASVYLSVILLGAVLLSPLRQAEAQDRTSWNLPADFSSVQGSPGVSEWYYYRLSGSSYVQLVWDPEVNGLGNVGNCWSPQYGGNDSPRFLYIQGVAGSYTTIQTGEHANAAIGWRAPRAGTVMASGAFTAVSTSTTYNSWMGPEGDDGVYITIRHGSTVAAGPVRVLHGSPEFQSNSLAATLNVAAGDFVYFYVDRGNWQDADAVYANLSVVYESTYRAWEDDWVSDHVSNRLNDVFAVSDREAWAVGSAGTILHYTTGMMASRGSWARAASPLAYEIYAVDMVSGTEGWAVGENGHALRYAGGAWSVTGSAASGFTMYGLDMLDANQGWAVGVGGRIYHYGGGTWHQDAMTGSTLYGVHMLSPTDGWAVGSGGRIYHYDGTSWTAATSPTNRALFAVSMVSPSEGWAVGDAGTILHYTAAGGWQSAASPVTTALRSVAMAGANEGWAVGDGGVVLHYLPGGWHSHGSASSTTLRAVALADANTGWAVGSGGAVLRYGLRTPSVTIDRPMALVAKGSPASFNLFLRDATGAAITDAYVTATLWGPGFHIWGGGNASYVPATGAYNYVYTVPTTDPAGEYSVQFRITASGYSEQVVWSYFAVGSNSNVWVLLLTNFQRMRDLGYSDVEVQALRSSVYDLAFGNPNGVGAVIALENVPSVAAAYPAWAASPGDKTANNALVDAIDDEIERLRRDVYPNLCYVIIVGSSEVIPMYARDDDPTWVGDNEDDYWAAELSDASYVRSLSYHGEDGRYLTDNVYADLAYRDGSDDHELTPELMVGRLVETPRQIGRLIDDYLSLPGGAIEAEAIVLASHDQLDTGNAVFSGYPGGADRSNVNDSYSPSAFAAYVSAGNVYVAAGHASRNTISTGGGTFYAGGCETDRVGTYDVRTAEGSAMFTVGCHDGVSLGNKLHGDPATDDRACPGLDYARYMEFPEAWADAGMLAYAGSTSYAMGTASGIHDYASMVGGTEALVADITDSGLLVGMTVGQAWRDGILAYWNETEYCTFWLPFAGCLDTAHTDYNRKAIGGYVLYGIPTLRINASSDASGLEAMAAPEPEPTTRREILSAASGTVVEHATIDIPTYRIDPQTGAVEIPGAVQRVLPGEPVLPVLTVQRTVPRGAAVTGVAVDTGASTYVELDGHLPVLDLTVGDSTIPNGFSATDYFPAGLAMAIDQLSAEGRGTTVGMSIIPVQYNPVTGKVRIWTHIVANLTYTVPDTGVSLTSLAADKATYALSETVALTGAASNTGAGRDITASVRLYDARTGTALGIGSLGQLTLPAGASNQPFSLALADFGTSLEGRQVGLELQFYDAATGDLLASAETSVAVSDQTAPGAPRLLRADPQNGAVALTWELRSEPDVWQYKVYWGYAPGVLSNVAPASPNTARYTITGLTNMTTYYFAISAVDVSGRESALSEVRSATPATTVYLPLTRAQPR